MSGHRSCSVVLFVAAAAFAGVAVAAEPLTLDEALALAEQHSPRLRVSAAQLEGARAGVVTARQFPNPEIEALGGRQGDRVPGVATGSVAVFGLSQPIDLPMVRDPRIRGAEAGLAGSEFAFAEARLALRATVKQAFYDVLRRQSEFELARDNEALLAEIRNRIEVRVNVGEAPKFELTRADTELAAARNATNSARLRVSQAVAILRSIIGTSIPATVKGEVPPVPPVPPLDAALETALARYPAIAQAEADVRRAEARLERERAARIPQPTLRAGVEREPEINKFVVGVAIPIPVFNQRQGEIGEAVAQLQEVAAAAEQRRLEVRAALESAYSRFDVARQQIAAFEGGLIRQAEDALRVAEAAFRFGERGFIDVLDAQRVLRNVRTEFLAARFEKEGALIDIERLLAQDLERPGK